MSKFINNLSSVLDNTTNILKNAITDKNTQNMAGGSLSDEEKSNTMKTTSTIETTPSNGNIISPNPNQPTNTQIANFEKSLNNAYLGCFRDDPNNQKMKYNLGNVNNQLECMNKGRNAGLKYVALQNGNECYGSMSSDFMTDAVERSYCDIPCSDQGTGNCGGTYFNQAYLVDNKTPQYEHFVNINDTNNCMYWIILILIVIFILIN